MIHNDVQNQLALLVKTSAPPLIEVADSPIEAPQWVPGQRLPAHIIASLPNGRFQVQVENQMLDMNLPRNSEPGETLELTFITASPRMTFALTPELERSLPAPANSGVTLSDTAKFLGALLQKGNEAANNQSAENRVATAELARAVAVVPGAPPETKEFALALRAAVSQSGLFYESHQALWVSGERTLASLLHEPQAQLPVLAAMAGPRVAQDVPDQPRPAGDAMLRQASQGQPGTSPREANSDFVSRATTMHATEDVGIPREPVHRLAQPIVQQQLDTLESRQIFWQGQVWPGQQMDWEIDEDGSHGDGDGDDAPRWRTSLHLEMPTLGGVTAKLVLDGSGVRVDFLVDRDQTAARMRGGIAGLVESMEAAGIKVAGLTVNQHESV